MINYESIDLDPQSAALEAVLCHVLLQSLHFLLVESLFLLSCCREFISSGPILVEIGKSRLNLLSFPHKFEDGLKFAEVLIHHDASCEDLKQHFLLSFLL